MGKSFANDTMGDRSLAGRHILLVEDEYFIAQDLARAVHLCGGIVVGPVATSDEALALARDAARIDVAVIDIDLGGIPAYALVDELTLRDVPVVFATGFTAEHIPQEYRHLPRWVKPYLSGTLAAALQHVVRPAAARP